MPRVYPSGSEAPVRYRRSPECAVRSVAGETILIPIRRGVADLEYVYTLDDVGSTIWKMLETARSEDDIVQGVVAEYDVSETEARRDVAEFLADLQTTSLALKDE